MPTVRTYGVRKVATDALPGVRKSAAETPLSRGAGLEEAKAQTDQTIGRAIGGALSGVGADLAKLADDEREKAADTDVLEKKNALALWQNQRLFDPTSGALTMKGKDAMPLPEAVGAEYEAKASELAAGLSTDRARAKFARVRADGRVNLDATLRRHVFGEMQAYESTELDKGIENAINAGISNANDPRAVAEQLASVSADIRAHGPRVGLSPEAVTAKDLGARSALSVGVVKRLIDNKQIVNARSMFDGLKQAGNIRGEDLGDLEKALTVGTTRHDAQQLADSILAAGGTREEQRTKAKQADGDVREEALSLIEHEWAIKASDERATDEARLGNAYNVIGKTGNVHSIPASDWEKLGAHQPALREWALKIAKGEPSETDWATYSKQMSLAGEDPATFVKQNIYTLRPKLGDAEFKQLTDLKLSIQKGDLTKADAQLAGFRTKDQILKQTLQQYGIPTEESKQTAAQQTSVAEIGRMLDRNITAAETGGKKATNGEIQQALDDILAQGKTVPGSFWGGLLPWSGGHFRDTTTRNIDLQPSDVPATERALIVDALTRKKLPITDATILDAYIRGGARAAK